MRSLAVIALFASFSALACPNLSGSYATCRSTTGQSQGSSDLVVSQSESNGITSYTITETDAESSERTTQTVAADGQVVVEEQTDAETGMVIRGETVASCTGNNLNVTVVVSAMGQEFGNVTLKAYKSGNQLIQELSGTTINGPINDQIICE